MATLGIPSYGIPNKGIGADKVNYTNASVAEITNVKNALDYILRTGYVEQIKCLHFSDFPPVGTPNTIYIDIDSGNSYYWYNDMYNTIHSEIVVSHTCEEWSNLSNYVSQTNCIYIYSDYRNVDGDDIPGIKFGDGNSYVVDLPFHTIGVTQSDIDFWNNKVAAKITPVDLENLVLYTSRD